MLLSVNMGYLQQEKETTATLGTGFVLAATCKEPRIYEDGDSKKKGDLAYNSVLTRRTSQKGNSVLSPTTSKSRKRNKTIRNTSEEKKHENSYKAEVYLF
jgi:hypothetical protein